MIPHYIAIDLQLLQKLGITPLEYAICAFVYQDMLHSSNGWCKRSRKELGTQLNTRKSVTVRAIDRLIYPKKFLIKDTNSGALQVSKRWIDNVERVESQKELPDPKGEAQSPDIPQTKLAKKKSPKKAKKKQQQEELVEHPMVQRIKQHYKNVAKMDVLPTWDECEKLKKRFGAKKVDEMLQRMDNYKYSAETFIYHKNSKVYNTLINWFNREKQRADKGKEKESLDNSAPQFYKSKSEKA